MKVASDRQTAAETPNVAFIGDDEALSLALKAGQRGSREALYDRYAVHVRRVLVRTLGTSVDLQDHLHNVFIEAFASTHTIRDGRKLKAWLTKVAVFTAIAHIRRCQRKRWLSFAAPEDLPEQAAPVVDMEKRETLRLIYGILDKLPPKERVPFCLRHIDGMPLQDVAEACDVSLATVKRRIIAAQKRFEALVAANPTLLEIFPGKTTEENK